PRAKALLAAALLAATPPGPARADQTSELRAEESVVIQGSVDRSTVTNNISKTFNGIDPAVLVDLTKDYTNRLTATAEAKARAEAQVQILSEKLGFTTDAVGE